ncbi:MAG TPA: hypothetical protein VGN37_05905 [Actinocatenispora sp.]
MSLLGSSVTRVALPLTAVVVLHASPLSMGLLGAAALLPHLVLGLPAGVWIGRLPYHRVLVLADVAQAVLLGAVPVLALTGLLAMWQLRRHRRRAGRHPVDPTARPRPGVHRRDGAARSSPRHSGRPGCSSAYRCWLRRSAAPGPPSTA